MLQIKEEVLAYVRETYHVDIEYLWKKVLEMASSATRITGSGSPRFLSPKRRAWDFPKRGISIF